MADILKKKELVEEETRLVSTPCSDISNDSIDNYFEIDRTDDLDGNGSVKKLHHHVLEMEYDQDNDDDGDNDAEVYVTKMYNNGITETPVLLYPLDFQKSKLALLQIIASVVMFTVFGMTDQTTGSLMPVLTEYYQVSELNLSYIFLMQVIGYTISALMNSVVHEKVGRRGVIVGSGMIFVVSTFVLTLRPPFYIYCFFFFPIGLAIGFVDSSANVLFASFVRSKNEILGIVHGTYGAASFITPLVATRYQKDNWNNFFYFPLCAAIVATLMSCVAFKYETSEKYNYLCTVSTSSGMDLENEEGEEYADGEDFFHGDSSFLNLICTPITLISSFYIFAYQGLQASVGTWMLTYLLKIKHGSPERMAVVVSCFWIGLTLGRFFLGAVTSRFYKNEYAANKWYGVFTIVSFSGMFLSSMFDFEHKLFLIVFTCCVSMAGFWLAPVFPNVNVVMMTLVPVKYQVKCVGITISLGISGAAVLPSLCGFLANLLGYQVLPFLYLSGAILLEVTWLIFPKLVKTSKSDKVF